ncbi:MAG: DUF4380 domain-containing protein [Pirellulaceae bacterium]|nr:DUF4380 domain-containing protein [Pirellulaceae bacterium]
MSKTAILRLLVLSSVWVGCWLDASQAIAVEGAKVVRFYGYDDCIELTNATTRVVLCPAAGGRILYFGIGGKNILYLPEGNEGWVWDGKSSGAPMNAGRCDIGPEQVVPPRPMLWQGRWQGEILSDRQAVLRSQDDASTGVRLERTFALAADSSKLSFTQTIVNISQAAVEYCHWSRTFVQGHGTCVVPVSNPKRFPQHYVRYDPPGKLINFAPSDPQIQLVDDCLLIKDHPLHPKLGFDSHRGWLAYCSPQNLLFVKKFPTYPDRAYNEVAGLTISVWYPADNMVELEPIGPREKIEPGKTSSFTETWFLLDYALPSAGPIDLTQIKARVDAL